MPCDSGGYGGGTVVVRDKEAEKRARALTALLCETCKAWPADHPMPETLRLWWQAHQAVDIRRAEKARLKREASIARLRRQQQEILDELNALEGADDKPGRPDRDIKLRERKA